MGEEIKVTAEAAIDRYADMVYRLAVSQVGNSTDADDIFQEVFVRLVKHIHKLHTWEHVKAWLIKVTVNCSRKHFAQYWNKNVYKMEKPEEIQSEENTYIAEEHPVTAVVGRLPSKYRAVVHLFYYEEFSVAEIGKLTGQKEATVKSQLFRAREMLREMLEGDVDF